MTTNPMNDRLHSYLDLQPEVAAALSQGRPVVALESTIISHGMPYPQNVEMARGVEQIVRDNGAVPATIAVLGGRLKVGLSAEELELLATDRAVQKISTRDLPVTVALGGHGRRRWPPPCGLPRSPGFASLRRAALAACTGARARRWTSAPTCSNSPAPTCAW